MEVRADSSQSADTASAAAGRYAQQKDVAFEAGLGAKLQKYIEYLHPDTGKAGNARLVVLYTAGVSPDHAVSTPSPSP